LDRHPMLKVGEGAKCRWRGGGGVRNVLSCSRLQMAYLILQIELGLKGAMRS